MAEQYGGPDPSAPRSFEEAREALLARVAPIDSETLPLERAAGRRLAEDARADMDAPPFDRSPYDGYAFRAADSAGAGRLKPARLKIVGELAAGAPPPAGSLAPGSAMKILTGAPIPAGADAVVKFEDTAEDAETVALFEPVRPGWNIIPAGEDLRAGELIAARGASLGPALIGSLAAQGRLTAEVFRRPRAGLISTGPELVEPGRPLRPGTVYDSNRFALAAACQAEGAETVHLGQAGDRTEDIAALMAQGFKECDLIISTGGVSVGDYDFTPAALAAAGAEILVRGLALRPGGACAYALKDGRPAFALSGNPGAALINFYAVVRPVIRKLCGCPEPRPPLIKVRLLEPVDRPSPVARPLAGRFSLTGEGLGFRPLTMTGKGSLSGLAGCQALALIPAGSPPLAAGALLDAWPVGAFWPDA